MKHDQAAGTYCRLWLLLNQSCDAIGKARENKLRVLGISMAQAAALGVVKRSSEPATPAIIARFLFREPHTVSGLLNRMLKQGLVKKTRDPESNRLVVILTEKGEELYRRSRQVKVVEEILCCLSEQQCDALRECLEVLRSRALEELIVRPEVPFP